MDKGTLTGIIFGVVIFIALISMMAGSGSSRGGGKKMKFLNHKLGYVGLVVVILAALGLGGVVNTMM